MVKVIDERKIDFHTVNSLLAAVNGLKDTAENVTKDLSLLAGAADTSPADFVRRIPTPASIDFLERNLAALQLRWREVRSNVKPVLRTLRSAVIEHKR